MAATSKGSSRTRYGLIGLLAVRQAMAIQQRNAREAAARVPAAPDEPPGKPRKRGWFG